MKVADEINLFELLKILGETIKFLARKKFNSITSVISTPFRNSYSTLN